MDFKELTQKRYSCKNYSNRPVEGEALQSVLEAGRMAPTAKNLQEHHVYVIESAEGLSMIDEVTPCRYGAPICLVVTFDKTNVFTYPGGKRDSGIEDATIVATHMLLATAAVGLNSCWVNNFDPDILHEKMQLPEHEEILMIMDIGHAAEGHGPLPNHFSRKPLDETVTYR